MVRRALCCDISQRTESMLFLDLLIWGVYQLGGVMNGEEKCRCGVQHRDMDNDSSVKCLFVHKNTKLGYSLKFYRCTLLSSPQQHITPETTMVQLVEHARGLGHSKVIAHATVNRLRTFLDPVLPMIRFETLTRDEILEFIEPTAMFSPQEILLFLKAGYSNTPKQIEDIPIFGHTRLNRQKRAIST